MEKSLALLRELRAKHSVRLSQVERFMRLCKKEAVPEVTVYSPAGSGERYDWYQMYQAFVFSSRDDIARTVWFLDPRKGLLVYDADGKNAQPYKEWDPTAEIFFDANLCDRGATNMSPPEREALMRRAA